MGNRRQLIQARQVHKPDIETNHVFTRLCFQFLGNAQCKPRFAYAARTRQSDEARSADQTEDFPYFAFTSDEARYWSGRARAMPRCPASRFTTPESVLRSTRQTTDR